MEPDPAASLQVYTVWLPVLPGDAPTEWDPALLSDPRVTHFWDPSRITGRWFREQTPGTGSLAWDIYFLYTAEATWDTALTPPVSMGSPVIAKQEQLRTELQSVWK